MNLVHGINIGHISYKRSDTEEINHICYAIKQLKQDSQLHSMSNKDYFQAIDNRCGTTHNVTALSVFSATSSGIMMLFTIPLNAVIVYCILKERKRRFKSLFYKLLLNIAVADLLTGLIVDPTTVNAISKEALREKLKTYEVYFVHLSLFFTDAVALITMTILSIERILALILPIKHHQGMKKKYENLLVFATWPTSFALVAPYFRLNFIKELLVFSTIDVVACTISLVVTTLIVRRSVTKVTVISKNFEMTSMTNENPPPNKRVAGGSNSSATGNYRVDMNNCVPIPIQNNPLQVNTKIKKSKKKEIESPQAQKKATRAFILMLVVFVVTYLPTCVTMIYMNVCPECDCLTIHVMRDISILSILSSSLFRPLNFILTLKHLRKCVRGIFIKSQRDSITSTTTGVGYSG